MDIALGSKKCRYLYDHQHHGVDEVQGHERPTLGADVGDHEARSGKRDVDGAGEEGRRQDGDDRHRPDDQQDGADRSDLKASRAVRSL